MAEMSAKDGLQAKEVAEYLRQHPQFLKEYPDLAMQLRVPREQGQAASLASYQLDVLRDKNREHLRRQAELIEIASDNERLMIQVHALAVALLRAPSLEQAVRCVVARLTEDFHTDLVRLLLFRDGTSLPQANWLLLLPDGAAGMQAFAEFLARTEPLVGRLAADKLQHLFGDQAEGVQSVALMRLDGLGMLAIGSTDANRFHPGMGTIFIKMIAEAATAALTRFPAEE